jgi:hypothetical protein
MTRTKWATTLTRPVGHLVGTIATTANAVVCAVLAAINPPLQPALVLLATIPAVIWYTAMAWSHHRGRAER